MVKIPQDFDGTKFEQKYSLGKYDFYALNGELYCEKLPNLTEADLLDCVTVYVPQTRQVFDLPVYAPDFIVQSPKPKVDPLAALTEAIEEAAKADKSIALIVLDLVKYLEEVEKRLKKAKV